MWRQRARSSRSSSQSSPSSQDEKTYSIGKSAKKFSQLDADVGNLNTTIEGWFDELKGLDTQIGKFEGEMQKSKEEHNAQYASYEAQAKAAESSATALQTAIASMESGKGEVGSAEMEKALGLAKALASSPSVSLLSLSAAPAPAYEYKSGDVTSTRKALLTTFKENKHSMDIDEVRAKSSFDKQVFGLSNEKKLAERSKQEKTLMKSQKDSSRATAQKVSSEEARAEEADEAFLDTLKADYEDKATQAEQRLSAGGAIALLSVPGRQQQAPEARQLPAATCAQGVDALRERGPCSDSEGGARSEESCCFGVCHPGAAEGPRF
ncbi:unnamed protein product [Polarella glacialis]|uniref:Uncharacterized protein n=1 Tax=Polarella glacialis TaxID=89957 RepID=A0A813KQ11_POLGL|nr:unnamed protein product [Polarella glacialis]